MKIEINKDIGKQWNPEQIAGRRKLEGKDTISHEWIYQYIYEDKNKGGNLYINLRNGHKKRKRKLNKKDNRGIIPDKKMIAQRPEIVNKKNRLCDWEGDTVIGANHKGVILTLTKRKSKFLLAKKLHSKNEDITADYIIELLKDSNLPEHTNPFDYSKEFAEHKFIAKKLNTGVFFANPYHSWENRHNENTNGML